MSEWMREKRRYRIGVRCVWVEKYGIELMSRPKVTKSCSARRRRRRRRKEEEGGGGGEETTVFEY
jgi:hypothetical protein